MAAEKPSALDLLALIHELDGNTIRARLEQLHAEAVALRVLYRAAVSRDAAERRRTRTAKGGDDARPP